MKCIKNAGTEKIIRVSDMEAIEKIRTNEWFYVPKTEWKEKVRDLKIKKEETKVEEKQRSKKKKKNATR